MNNLQATALVSAMCSIAAAIFDSRPAFAIFAGLAVISLYRDALRGTNR